AESVDAGEILVAAALVDAALAPELGFQRQHRHAVGLHAAIATAFADGGIDHDALGRINHQLALAAATFLGSAGLVVDKHADAGNFAQALLHRIELVAVDELDARREQRRLRPFADV